MSIPATQIVLTAKNLTGSAFAQIKKDVGGLRSPVGELKAMLAGLGATIGVGALAHSFLEAGIYADRMSRALSNVLGSSKSAEEAIRYLNKESNRTGQVFEDQIKGFTLLSAATKGTELAGEKTKQMYSDLMEASTAFQLSQEDAYLSVRAIQQMLNKGTIQAEEFRGQFGERIPAAFEALKKITGATDKQIGEMMKQGKLYSADIVPNLLRMISLMNKTGLAETAKSTQAEINRLKNSWFDLRKTVMASGFTDELSKGIRSVTEELDSFIKNNEEGFKKLAENAITAIKSIIAPVNEIREGFMAMWSIDWAKTVFATSLMALLTLVSRRFAMIYAVIKTAEVVNREIQAAGAVAGGGLTFNQWASMNGEELEKHLDALNKGGAQFAITQNMQKAREEAQKLTKEIASLEKINESIYKNRGQYVVYNPILEDKRKQLANLEQHIANSEKTLESVKDKGIVGPVISKELQKKRLEDFTKREMEAVIKDTQEKMKLREGEGESKGAKVALKKAENEAKRRAKAERAILEDLTGFENSYSIKIQKVNDELSDREIKLNQLAEASRKLDESLKEKALGAGIKYDPSVLKKITSDLKKDIEEAFSPDKALKDMRKYVDDFMTDSSWSLSDAMEELYNPEGTTRSSEIEYARKEFEAQLETIKKIYGVTDKYNELWDDIELNIRDTNENLKKIEIAQEIGDLFSSGIRSGFEDGFNSIGDNVFSFLTDKLQEKLSNVIAQTVASSVGTGFGSQLLGGGIGALAGSFIGSVGNSLFGGGSNRYDALRESQNDLMKEIAKNTKATQENTDFKKSGQISSSSQDIFDLRTQILQTKETLHQQLKDLRDPSDILRPFIDKATGRMDVMEMINSMGNDVSSWSSILDGFKSFRDQLMEEGRMIHPGLESIIASLEEFATNIDLLQKDILDSLRSDYESLTDEFLSESERNKKGINTKGRDSLLGLAETFGLEGLLSQDVIQEMSKLQNVQDISKSLLDKLVPGTEAYNKAMEASLLLYSTAKMNIKSILQDAREEFNSAGDEFRTESEILKRESEKSGRETLLGIATFMKDTSYVEALEQLSSVQEISKKLLSDLIPGTEDYNQVMEASLLIYETARLEQQSMFTGLQTSIGDWKTQLEQRNWGLSEWSNEFSRIGASIDGLNVLSDSYYSDAVTLAEKQFDALKQIASLSEAQLMELQNSSKSLNQQLWEFSQGGEADTISISEWMKRGEALYTKASSSLKAEDISDFQSFLPELKDAMLSSGYNYSYITDQFQWALNSLLDKVNTSMDSMSKSIDKLPDLAPTVQPINITLKIDGRELSNVIIEQLNTNTNLINAVRRVA